MLQINAPLVVGERNLHATLFVPDEMNGSAVLYTHGYTANSNGYAEFAEATGELGVTGLTLDLSSHGQSEGTREDLTIAEYRADMREAYDFLASHSDIDPKRIGVMAGSFGAYLAVLLSIERPIESLLLRVPALYPDELNDTPRREFDTDEVLRTAPDPNNSALEAVRNFGGNVLLVSSDKDEIIMPSTISAYAQAIQKGEHLVMHNTQHVLDTESRSTFKDVLVKWASDL